MMRKVPVEAMAVVFHILPEDVPQYGLHPKKPCDKHGKCCVATLIGYTEPDDKVTNVTLGSLHAGYLYPSGQSISPAIARYQIAFCEYGYVFPFDQPHWMVTLS